MKRKIVLLFLSMFLLLFSFPGLGRFNQVSVKAPDECPVYNLNTGKNYTTIQEAIDANDTLDGHTIKVCAGVYYEHVRVDKSLSLFGEGVNNTIIYGNASVVEISAHDVAISNFTLANSYAYGVYIRAQTSNTTIRSNKITRTATAIFVEGQGPPTLQNRNITIAHNVIVNNTYGINLGFGSTYCSVLGNVITLNEQGLVISGEYNNFSENIVEDNFFGVKPGGRNNVLRGNEVNRNDFNIVTIPSIFPFSSVMPTCDVDTSNKINGRSIYYLVNESNMVINSSTHPDVGFLGLKGCENISIEGLTLRENSHGVILEECVNCTVRNCLIQYNMVGAFVDAEQTSIVGSQILDNYHGILMTGSNNSLEDNDVTNNTVRSLPYWFPDEWPPIELRPFGSWIDDLMLYSGGIYLVFADNCTLVDNRIMFNEHGVLLHSSSFSVFRNNSLAANMFNFGIVTIDYLIPPEWGYDPPDPPMISPYLSHQVDTSNTVDGKLIYYWVNHRDETVPLDAGYVALVNCTDITVNHTTLANNFQGILLAGANNTMIFNNTIMNTRCGIDIQEEPGFITSTNNTLLANTIVESGIGITSWGRENEIRGNHLTSNLFAIASYDGNYIAENMITHNVRPSEDGWILGRLPSNFNNLWWLINRAGAYGNELCFGGIVIIGACNTIIDNRMEENRFGLHLNSLGSMNITKNIVAGNQFSNNIYGVWLFAKENTFIHNNFLNNTHNVYIDPSLPSAFPSSEYTNQWDNGVEGNYWSDHNGTDVSGDGISDANYTISYGNVDSYPLMGPFNDFTVAYTHHVATICNSTISEFTYNGTSISFNVSGANGTVGFCRVCIPTALMNHTYRIFVNGAEVSHTLLPISNSTYSHIIFTYNHSTREVAIIPEFHPHLISFFLLTITLLFTMLRRKSED